MRLECVPRRRLPVRVKVGARQYCRVAYNTARLLDRIPFEVVALKRQEAGFIVMLVNAPQPDLPIAVRSARPAPDRTTHHRRIARPPAARMANRSLHAPRRG